MILMKELKEFPDGSDILLTLLQKFPALNREQIIIYFIQKDKTYNRERVEDIINFLLADGSISKSGDNLKLSSTKEVNENIINAFWVFLHYVDSGVAFDLGSYPSEIIFMKDKELNEIIIMDDDAMIKMDYLSKRKHRKNKCRYNFLFTSGTIDEFDDELFDDVAITLITMSPGKNSPKLVYHEVENE